MHSDSDKGCGTGGKKNFFVFKLKQWQISFSVVVAKPTLTTFTSDPSFEKVPLKRCSKRFKGF